MRLLAKNAEERYQNRLGPGSRSSAMPDGTAVAWSHRSIPSGRGGLVGPIVDTREARKREENALVATFGRVVAHGSAELQERYTSLSLRERQVMALVVSGLLNKQVGSELGISDDAKMRRLSESIGVDRLSEIEGAMKKNETELIMRLAQVTNNCIGAPPGPKRASYRPCLLSAALAVLFSVSGWSQTQLATVSGAITDPSGAVVPGVSVTIVSQGTGLKRSALTDTAGEYRFAGLPTGNYSLRLEKTGFQSQIRQGVELTSAAEVMINSQLAIGGLSQETTVRANVAGIESTTSTVTGLLPEQSLTELPLNNRDLFSAVTLEPGVAPNPSSGPSLLSSGKSGQVAINGSRPSMTNVLIDGMDATDPVLGYSPAGASGFFLGLNELAEVRVLTQTFNAEYGGHGARSYRDGNQVRQ